MELTSNSSFSRPWLESLSTAELIKLADSIGIDIPPGLERIFIIEEIMEEALENSETDGQNGDDIQINPSYSEPAVLPKQYNISYIDVIIRDPLWVYAFWEIKGHDREQHENSDDFEGYFLRVIPLKEGENSAKSSENSFTVSISADDSARYLGFTELSEKDAGRYVVKLGVLRGSSEIQLASSQPFTMPKIPNYAENENSQNPLIFLSGVQDFSLIKSTDRQSRIKRQ